MVLIFLRVTKSAIYYPCFVYQAQLASDEQTQDKKAEHVTGSHKKNPRQGRKKHKKKTTKKSQHQEPQVYDQIFYYTPM